MHDYNSTRQPLILKEYGRNVQKMVEALQTIPDKAQRTAQAQGILNIMAILDANTKQSVENLQKRWDDLFIIADYTLDVDSPYPKPAKGVLEKKPPRPAYTQRPLKFRNYGRNIEHLIQKAIHTEDPAEQEPMVLEIVRLMKTFSKEGNIDTILANLKYMSDNKLGVDVEKLKAQNSFSTVHRDKTRGNNRKRKTS
ncbi:MAG: DUF4290 domain-containing protein [Bacteroidota bacterium]